MTKESIDNLPSEDEVRKYLQENPNFLEENPDILEHLTISHKSGKAVSLVERQLEVMRDRNKEMGRRVDQMMTSANDNSQLFEKTNRLVMGLIKATSLAQLVDALQHSLDKDFLTQTYSLTLINDGHLKPQTGINLVSKEDAEREIGTIMSTTGAVSGVIRDEEINFLFGSNKSKVGSVVTLPLTSGKNVFGVLAIGNKDPQYYSRDTGTLFISYIGELLDELLPRHLNL